MSTVIQNNLTELHDMLGTMSKMVIDAIEDAVDALNDKDIEKAKVIKKEDVLINNIRWEIEDKTIALLATHQPVASDLREIIALLNITTELERIGDYAAGIAKIVIMIENAMKAYTNHNEKSARLIHKQDDDIDNLYNQVYRELISFMIEKPGKITQCTYLLWVAHNLERIGDRVTNICERIIYLASGELAEDL